ncbi:MAG TPA: hypothetical protein VM186_05250, partial [Planctomycetota bacterium]|nr:hypothetical protein [Planctomycetota bacterium]
FLCKNLYLRLPATAPPPRHCHHVLYRENLAGYSRLGNLISAFVASLPFSDALSEAVDRETIRRRFSPEDGSEDRTPPSFSNAA